MPDVPVLTLVAGLLSVEFAGRTVFQDAHAAVTLADGRSFTTHGGEVQAAEGGWIVTTAQGLLWTIAWRNGALELSLALKNTQAYDVAIARLDVLVVPALQDPWDAVLQAGYMSWSHATPLVPLNQNTRPVTPPVGFPLLPLTEAQRFVSCGLTLLGTAAHTLLVGFTRAQLLQPYVALQGQRLCASCEVENKRLVAGSWLEAEPLLLLFDRTEPDALEAYARAVALEANARSSHPIPTGWCSWYYYFTDISEAAMLGNLDVLDAYKATLPVSLVQLDDGYQTAIGDWLSVNAKFPRGLGPLVTEIHARGYQAGIWLAPFFLGEHSQTYLQHPDWVVKDEAGLPIDALTNWQHRNFALDTTHPGARSYLREVFETVTKQWGFDFLKLDFLYAGALRGRRYDPDATGLSAYRQGLALIREVVGERFILGCGAPFLPSVGFVDGMRVGPDTAPTFADPDPRGLSPALFNALRSTLAHHWMHRHWWINDPDCLIVREADSELTLPEVESWATVIALSGGMVLLSDNLALLEPARRALIPRLLPPLGAAARPLGPWVDGVATRLQLPLRRPWGDFELRAQFNWTDAPQATSFDAQAACYVFDVWEGSCRGPCLGTVPLAPLAPHGVRLLAIFPVGLHPQFVGSTLTLTAGAQELESVTWAEHRLTLAFQLAGLHTGEVVIAIPPGYRAKGSATLVGPAFWRVPLTLDHHQTLVLDFEEASV